MDKSSTSLVRHNIYLSRQIWGELKLRSFQEGSNASEIINYVLEQAFKQRRMAERLAPPTARYRSHARDDDRLGRTVYFQPETWDELQQRAREEQFSAAGLVERLLERYLGLAPTPGEEDTPPRYLTVGDLTIDLGEDRRSIDYRTGQAVEEKSKK
jgi:hypothetical protein